MFLQYQPLKIAPKDLHELIFQNSTSLSMSNIVWHTGEYSALLCAIIYITWKRLFHVFHSRQEFPKLQCLCVSVCMCAHVYRVGVCALLLLVISLQALG